MKQIKCKNCNANIEYTSNDNTLICPYCNTKYSLTDEEQSLISKQNNLIANISPKQTTRPKINVGVAVILFLLYWPFGLIYIPYNSHKKKKWDEEHNNKKD